MFTIALFDELVQDAMLYEAGVYSNLGPTGVTKHWRHNKRKPICRVALLLVHVEIILTKVCMIQKILSIKLSNFPQGIKLRLLSPFAS